VITLLRLLTQGTRLREPTFRSGGRKKEKKKKSWDLRDGVYGLFEVLLFVF
jgi:hypothetical protein